MLDAGREGGGRLAEVVVEPRELGEAGEVEAYVGAEALRAGAGVAGEAPRGRLHLEEEVALPQEPLGPRSSVSSKRAPPKDLLEHDFQLDRLPRGRLRHRGGMALRPEGEGLHRRPP